MDEYCNAAQIIVIARGSGAGKPQLDCNVYDVVDIVMGKGQERGARSRSRWGWIVMRMMLQTL